MTELQRQYGTTEENSDGEKQDRRRKEKKGVRKETDWDLGSGIKLPICI